MRRPDLLDAEGNVAPVKSGPPYTWFWLDVGYACGGISCDESGIIRHGAPIFSRWKGRRFNEVIQDRREAGEPVRWARLG